MEESIRDKLGVRKKAVVKAVIMVVFVVSAIYAVRFTPLLPGFPTLVF